MSEQSGGPGWWMASDGRWYPPIPESIAPSQVGESASEKSAPWWKRPVPLWALILAAVVGIGLGGASASSNEDEDGQATTTTKAVAADQAEETTTTTTTEEPTTTTTEATTTTAPPTPEQLREQAKAEFQIAFDSTRTDVAEVLQGDINVETLDQLVFEPGADRVVVSITSTWASPDNQIDGAWEISRALAVLYERRKGLWWSEHYVPSLRLVNSGTTYDCSADVMVRMGSLEAGRDAWQAEC